MLHLLTGGEFDAAEALRIGLVQEVVAPGAQLDRAREIAAVVAAQAPLGVQGTLRNARLAWGQAEATAAEQLLPEIRKLMLTEDAQEGIQAFIERRDGSFSGR
jgi:enoyl-CoA hydratase/carnithine racemase